MKIVFRADASIEIGSGHVMRCLTLADQLRADGAEVTFVCRDSAGGAFELVKARGYHVARLPFIERYKLSQRVDAEETIKALEQSGDGVLDWLVIDHYDIDKTWEGLLRPFTRKIMVIDDLANRQHDCDLLLDQNYYHDLSSRYNTLIPNSCITLLGPTYVLLRPEFAEARKKLRERDGTVRRILIFFGGSDPDNQTQKTIEALKLLRRSDIAADIVVGAANPHQEQIKRMCNELPKATFHCQVSNMAELILNADLGIGAGGATTWERCAIGLPSLIIVLAENQLELVETGARQGLFFYLGKSKIVSSEMIRDTIQVLVSSPLSLQSYSTHSLATVDAKGTQRVARVLCPPPISIRKARLADCDSIYEWRNAEETRRWGFDGNPITLETHRAWFNNTLKNSDRVLLIGEIGNKPIGVLRYDFSGSEALISVYLVPGVQGKGIGSQLIRSGSQWIRNRFPTIKSITAEIFKENVASLRAFESAGYKEHHAIYRETL